MYNINIYIQADILFLSCRFFNQIKSHVYIFCSKVQLYIQQSKVLPNQKCHWVFLNFSAGSSFH